MSSTLRQAVPRVCRGLAVRARPSPILNATRKFHRRHVPVRTVFDDFFGPRWRPWPMRMMEDHMRSMEKMVDSMATPWSRVREAEFSVKPAHEMQVKQNAKEFSVQLKVGDFQPEDLTVKLVGDELSITGKISHTDAHGSVTSQFSRNVTLPENVDPETLESLFTQDGQLVVRAQMRGAEHVTEKTINITREQAPPGGDGKSNAGGEGADKSKN